MFIGVGFRRGLVFDGGDDGMLYEIVVIRCGVQFVSYRKFNLFIIIVRQEN